MRLLILSPVLAFLLFVAVADAQTPFVVGNTTVQTEVMASHLDVPWDLVLGPDGWVWFTQASGEVFRMDPDDGTLQLVYTVPDVHEFGFTAGLHSMAFHPDFANQPYVYLHYVISTTNSVIKRFTYDAGLNTFTASSDHLLSIPISAGISHNGSRMVVDDEGMFLISIGETMVAPDSAQNMATAHGKILRFAPDGSIPADNPIPGSYVYNWGHRNPQGLVKASNGHIYNSEHGQDNDDEIDLVLPDRDYGWPKVWGLCNTAAEETYCDAHDVAEPIHEFTSAIIAPSGLDYFDHPSIPEWQNSLLVAALRGTELHQLKLNATGDAVLEDNIVLHGTYGRLRDVLVLPDGRIFICTSNKDWAGTEGAEDDRIIKLTGPGVQTGMSAAGASALSMWPNPASGSVAVLGPTTPNAQMTLWDVTGKEVMHAPLVDGGFNVSLLQPGVYAARIVQGNGVARSFRLIVQRH